MSSGLMGKDRSGTSTLLAAAAALQKLANEEEGGRSACSTTTTPTRSESNQQRRPLHLAISGKKTSGVDAATTAAEHTASPMKPPPPALHTKQEALRPHFNDFTGDQRLFYAGEAGAGLKPEIKTPRPPPSPLTQTAAAAGGQSWTAAAMVDKGMSASSKFPQITNKAATKSNWHPLAAINQADNWPQNKGHVHRPINTTKEGDGDSLCKQQHLLQKASSLPSFPLPPPPPLTAVTSRRRGVERGLNPTVTGIRPVTEENLCLDVRFPESTNWKMWNFDETRNKLFAARDRIVSVCVRLSEIEEEKKGNDDKENSVMTTVAAAEETCWLTIVLLYSSNQHSARPVVKCPQHKNSAAIKKQHRHLPPPEDVGTSAGKERLSDTNTLTAAVPASEDDCVLVSHNHSEARLLQDPVSGRYFVMVPFGRRQLAEGCNLDLSFGCNNTCMGQEYSARQWNAMLALEDSQGEVLGRRLIKVKVCAAPKRERMIENGGGGGGQQHAKHRPPPNHQLGQLLGLSGGRAAGGKRMSTSPSSFAGSNSGWVSSPESAAAKVARVHGGGGGRDPVDVKDAEDDGVDEAGIESLAVSVRDRSEFELLLRIRDELRASPTLKALIEHRIH